jgi:hypothetical protein
MELTNEQEMSMVIDALQFAACCDVSSDITEDRQLEMGKLSVRLAKHSNYVSEDNHYYPTLIKDQPDHMDIIKDFLVCKD